MKDNDSHELGEIDGIGPHATAVARLRHLGSAIKVMVRILAPVAIALMALTFLVGVGQLVIALVIGSWLRFVAVVLAAAAFVTAALVIARARQMWKASRQPEVLASELITLLEVGDLRTQVVTNVSDVVRMNEGLRPIARARALWRVLQTMELVNEHIDSRVNVRFFLPPKLAETWLLLQITAVITLAGASALVIIPLANALIG